MAIRWLIAITTTALLGVSAIGLFLAVALVQGYSVPPQAYSFLSSRMSYPQQARDVGDLGSLPAKRPSVQAMRDLAFATYNVSPSARERLSKVPVVYAETAGMLGSYDADSGRITINQPYLPVIVHEYAHANFNQKPLSEKLGYLGALIRLQADHDARSERAKSLMSVEVDVAIRRAKIGENYNPVLESYARLVEFSGGDLNALPDSLRGYFADYLQSGPNHWTTRQRNTSTSASLR